MSRFVIGQRASGPTGMATQLLLHTPMIHHKFACLYEL